MKRKITMIAALGVFLALFIIYPLQVNAKPLPVDGANTNVSITKVANGVASKTECGTSILPCWSIPKLFGFIITVMTAGVGILAVGALVYAGILYTTAAGNPEQTKKAITMITNTVIGIVVYALMYLILNFVIPGGVVFPQ